VDVSFGLKNKRENLVVKKKLDVFLDKMFNTSE